MISLREVYIQLDSMIPLMKEQLSYGKAVVFTPQGVSMKPTIRGGVDKVVLRPVPERLNKYDMPLYRRDDGQYVLHRIVAVDKSSGEYTMMGDNQYYPEPHIRHDQIIAVVCAIVRDGREESVDAPMFKLYSRLWHFSRGARHCIVRAVRFVGRILKK